mmetsp:Transcript_74963/g.219596  ORF Transcript_74963/g.219596 Transcript_74963/m.219596 type:complete len:928 (-) Transcript_74963:71-2854(-)
MPCLTLADAVATGDETSKVGHATEKIRWLECFTDKERISEFCEATDPSGNLESNSSSGHKEYQDRLRAIALRQEGKEKAEIAEMIGRPTKFVQTWWRKDPKEVPKPPGVHEYLKTEFWRDVQIVRGFGRGLGIYEEALSSTEWVQQMANGREFKMGGGSRLKYDKEGNMRPQGNWQAKDGVLPGKLPKLDNLMQRLLVEQSIDDRMLKRPGLLLYPDGNAGAIVHRHEAWTALMSFGNPRILTVDGHPVFLRDGDLIVFGTQRHGVPKMCTEGSTFDDYGSRMSVVLFFMPTGQQAQGAAPWRAILDDEPSRKMTSMLRDAHLGSSAQMDGLMTGAKSAELKQLTDLGFDASEAAAALRATNFDVTLAVEALLSGNGPALLQEGGCDGCQFSRSSQVSALWARLQELQVARESAAATSSNGSGSASANCEDDEAMAARLQREADQQALSGSTDTDWEQCAILEQLQELEREEERASGGQSALSAQFAQYEEMLDAQDAEEWDGRGDLMVREWRQRHLHIEQQERSTTYAIGCGMQTERGLFELLSLHSIRVVYDFRVDAEQTGPQHLKPSHLEGACKRHAIHYRYAPLGREGAYGILRHLQSDEGRNMLAELVWWARRKRTAFLGAEEDWRKDPRLATAARLQEAGHQVLHVEADGSTAEHPADFALPDFVTGEEARLRTLEQQRLAGELKRTQKSAGSRSTEVIAQRLSKPQQEIDAGAELRKANTQAELCRIQRRLADLQRRSETADAKAGLGPKLLHVNKWVKAEAAQQMDNLAAGKTKDGKEKGKPLAGGVAPEPTGGSPGSASASSEHPAPEMPLDESMLMVECLGCRTSLPWGALAAGDGRCLECVASASSFGLEASMEASEVLATNSKHTEAVPESVAVGCIAQEVSSSLPQQGKPISRWARRRLEREGNSSLSHAAGCG